MNEGFEPKGFWSSAFSKLTGEFQTETHYMELTPHSGAIVRKLPGLEPGVDGER